MIERVSRSGIIAAGTTLIDKIKTIQTFPKPGMLVDFVPEISSVGGSPANVLINLSALDPTIKKSIVCVLGNDRDGDNVLNQLLKYEINCDHVRRTDKENTSTTEVFTETQEAGRRTFFHDRGANRLLGLSDFESIENQAKLFHLGYLLLLDRLDAPDKEYKTKAARLFSRMKNKGYITSLDLVSTGSADQMKQAIYPVLPYTDVLVMNEIEAQMLFKPPRKDFKMVEVSWVLEVAHFLINKGVRELVVVHFPEGSCAVVHDGSYFVCPSFVVKDIKGTIGAGDAFCAGLLYGVHMDLPLYDSLKIAHACAAHNLSSFSANGGTVSIEVICAWLKKALFRKEVKLQINDSRS